MASHKSTSSTVILRFFEALVEWLSSARLEPFVALEFDMVIYLYVYACVMA